MIRAAPLALLVVAAGGCGTVQSEDCRQYIECRRAFDEAAGNTRADLAAYEFDGDCWVDGQAASQCTDTCKEELITLREDVEVNEFDLAACEEPRPA